MLRDSERLSWFKLRVRASKTRECKSKTITLRDSKKDSRQVRSREIESKRGLRMRPSSFF